MRSLILSILLSAALGAPTASAAGPCDPGVDCDVVSELAAAVEGVPLPTPNPQRLADAEAAASVPLPTPNPRRLAEQRAFPHRPASGTARKVYDRNMARVKDSDLKLSAVQKVAIKRFYKSWEKNKGRYEAVADKTGVPAELIAALHWRESTGRFNRYLHQGDRLGRPAVNVPRNIPVFHKWEPAAVHAIEMKRRVRDMYKITEDTTDLTALASYAEYYNGLGYYKRGKPSPYVFSGTDQYSRGKYTSDGNYDPSHRDQQLGVATMIQYIWEQEREEAQSLGVAP